MAMSRFSLTLTAVLILGSAAAGFAQGNSVPLEPLLRNQDPRLVAIGAWKALGTQDEGLITIMLDMVERWDPWQRHRSQDGDRYDAMSVILDTLIQRREVVSSAGIITIQHTFPSEALILAVRLPWADQEKLLRAWYEDGRVYDRTRVANEGSDYLMIARVSAMILAQHREQGFAAGLLADSMMRLSVSVPDDGSPGFSRCLVDCEAKAPCTPESGGMQRVGWPHLFHYVLDENRPRVDNSGLLIVGPLLVTADGDSITYRRVDTDIYLNNCYYPAPLNAVTRHRLLADMLGIPDKDMTWSIQDDLVLPWTNDRQFLAGVSDNSDLEEAKLRSTVQAIFAKGLLTKIEAASTRPKLSITAFDDRQKTDAAKPALPQFAAKDQRTTYRIGKWQ
jgi:hypothetical protein